MKKIFWLISLATMCFASCSKDEVVTPSMIEPSEDFTATLSMSRTHLEGTSVLWDAADELTIFTKTQHNRQYKVKSGAETKTAVFSYVGQTGTSNAAINGSYAIYPYDAEAELTGNIIKTKWQAEQIYNASAVNLAYAPMVAYAATGTDLAFKNAGALLRFNLSAAANLPDTYTLQSIKVASAANNLAGTITIDPTADSKAVVTADGVKEVTLSGINAVIDATVKSFYVALPATVFAADDLKVTFAFAEGARTVTLPAFTLNQGSIKTIVHQFTADEFPGSTEEGLSVQVSTPEALQEAVVNPKVSTVVLTADIELTEPLSFGAPLTRAATANEGREFTLDLNGRAITQTKIECEAYSMIENLANLTITDSKGNGKIEITYTGTPSTAVAVNAISNKGNLVINGGTIINNGNGNQIGYVIDNYGGSSLTVNGGKIEANGSSYYDGIRLFCSNTQEINVTVNGGDISSIWAQNPTANKAGEVKGTVVINGGAVATTYYERFTTVKVKNGVTATVTPYGTDSDKTYSVEEEGYTVYNFVLPGEIASAEELAAAIEKGGNITLKLIRDITLTNTATIAKNTVIKMDMNGCNLHYAVDNDGKAAAIIANNGDLRIENSSNEESTISFVAADPDMAAIPGYATNTITNEATLYIGAGVKVTNESEGGASYAVDNKGKFTLNGGTLLGNRCALRIAKYNQDDVQFQMEGGLVKASTPAWIQLPGNDSSAAPKITVTINGGDFICTKAEEGDVLYTYSFGNSHANTVINIAGGNFLGGTVSIGSGYKGDVPTLNITGGTFDHDVVQWLANDEFNVLYQANANN